MDNKNILVVVVVAAVCLVGGFFVGGKFNSSVNYSCNGGSVSGGSTSIPQGSNSLSAAPGVTGVTGVPADSLRFGAVSGTETQVSGGGFITSNNTTTTIANTIGNAFGFQRTSSATSTFVSSSGTCFALVSAQGVTKYWTIQDGQGQPFVSSTSPNSCF